LNRTEITQLRSVFSALGQALTRLGDLIIAAEAEANREDDTNTALEQQQERRNGD
jgi:hypothetical protein